VAHEVHAAGAEQQGRYKHDAHQGAHAVHHGIHPLARHQVDDVHPGTPTRRVNRTATEPRPPPKKKELTSFFPFR